MKPLRILLANNTLSLLAGSETWIYTLATQLKEQGHSVECFSPDLGIISEELKKQKIPSHNNLSTSGVKPFSIVLEENQNFDYDVIIANHNHIVEYLRSQFPKTPIISTIHGVMHFLEDKGKKIMAPEHPALNSGVNQFVAVSEEVQELLKKEYNIDSLLIRNFIDVNRFDSKRPITPNKPAQFFINTNYAGSKDEEIEIIRKVARHYDAKLTAVGQNFSMALDLSRAMEDSDIVVGMGRSVLEGVAAGRLGIVHGRWGTGGVIHEGNIQELRHCNFSGRNSGGKLATPDELIAEIDKYYNQNTIDWGKKYIRQEHNAYFAAQLFVETARELLGQNIQAAGEVPIKKYRRASDAK